MLGTVAQQRARLPPPSQECTDPVAGDWKAHVYYEHVGQWYLFDLHIERGDGPRALIGSIDSEFWDGDEKDETPPPCGDGHHRQAVTQRARGVFDGNTVRFDAKEWKAHPGKLCGGPRVGYLLDRFSGVLEPERQEFQSLLNADAPEWKDVPTVFRRVACGSPVDEKDAPVAPPPFAPPSRAPGCGWF